MESQTEELCRLVSSNLIMTQDTILAGIRHNLILSHSHNHPGGITNMRFDLLKKLFLLKEFSVTVHFLGRRCDIRLQARVKHFKTSGE